MTALHNRLSDFGPFVVLGFYALVLILGHWSIWAQDLSAIYYAGHMYATGQFDLIYAAPDGFFGRQDNPVWLAAKDTHGAGKEVVFPFVYPPLWAAIAAPFSQMLDPMAFFRAVLIVHVAMIVAMVILAYRIAAPRFSILLWVVGVVFLLENTLVGKLALFHNQPQITVTFLMIVAFERYIARASVAAGILLGLAAAIKVSPVLLGLIFVLDRDWRAVLALGITGAISVLASFVIAGPALHWDFLERLNEISALIGAIQVNYALEHVLNEIVTFMGNVPRDLVSDKNGVLQTMGIAEPLWITLVTKIFLVVAIPFTFVMTTHLDFRDRTMIRLICLWIVSALASPLAWAHHFLLLVFFLPVLFRIHARGPALGMIALITGALLTESFVFFAALSSTIFLSSLVGFAAICLVYFAFLMAPRDRKA